jgi:hypothetical protein
VPFTVGERKLETGTVEFIGNLGAFLGVSVTSVRTSRRVSRAAEEA